MKKIKYPNNIKKIIESRGISLKAISDITTIPYSTICKMAEGYLDIRKSQLNILNSLAKHLLCNIEDFFVKEKDTKK